MDVRLLLSQLLESVIISQFQLFFVVPTPHAQPSQETDIWAEDADGLDSGWVEGDREKTYGVSLPHI